MGRRFVHMGTIPIIRMPVRRMAFTVRSGSWAESLSAPDLGTIGAGVTVLIGVARAIGAAEAGVNLAGDTSAAMLADTDGAMPAGPTEAAMQVTTAIADTRVVMPVPADIMGAARSMEAVAITGADSTVVEVPTVAEAVSTAEAVTAADAGN